MRLQHPRIAPLPESEWTDEQREILARTTARRDHPLNIFTTLERHAPLLKRWLVFGNHVLFGSTFPARERELVILRVGALCKSEYEFAQHTRIGKMCGLTDEEIDGLKRGIDAHAWTACERTLLTATDELHADQMIGDATWTALRGDWTEEQVLDFLFTVGQYTLVSMVLNTLGVQVE